MAEQFQKMSAEITQLQTELAGIVAAREKLESQQQENKNVQKEFASLDDDAEIYKKIGPVLLKQERTEAVNAVEGRLSFIGREIERIEKQIKELEAKGEQKQTEILQFQAKLQKEQEAAAKQAAEANEAANAAAQAAAGGAAPAGAVPPSA
ncbi:hypothetical protein KEM55_008417 [Ascosphaera atra]|nr:hypothetical protein KEM55_008417 [Ascosphaera atra]